MRPGSVVRRAEIQADRQATGASVATLLDTGAADPASAPGLVRRAVEIPPGARFTGVATGAGELLFVIAGTGRLDADGQPPDRRAGLSLQPDRGVWLPPGTSYQVSPDRAAVLRLDAVELPAAAAHDPVAAIPAAGPAPRAEPAADPAAGAGPTVRDLGDCEVERTGDRTFRVLFGPGRGCSVATQFAGEIPPGRAPDHSHPYDEVVLILAGQGAVHIDGTDHELAPGTCVHLRPGQVHCLENTGAGVLRVLGVFYPADSPAAKLPGAAQAG